MCFKIKWIIIITASYDRVQLKYTKIYLLKYIFYLVISSNRFWVHQLKRDVRSLTRLGVKTLVQPKHRRWFFGFTCVVLLCCWLTTTGPRAFRQWPSSVCSRFSLFSFFLSPPSSSDSSCLKTLGCFQGPSAMFFQSLQRATALATKTRKNLKHFKFHLNINQAKNTFNWQINPLKRTSNVDRIDH